MSPAAILLDASRLASRLGQGALTGIDRVELAYLRGLAQSEIPLFGLLRTPAGVLFLACRSLLRLAAWAEGAPLPETPDLIGRLGRRTKPRLAAIEAVLRREAIGRAPVALAGRAAKRFLPSGSAYLNVGHTNLSPRMLGALRRGGLRVVVMLHDTIPLDHPEFARDGQAAVFSEKVKAISAGADVVLHTANATRKANEAQLARFGRVPPGITAPLGIDLVLPDASGLPPGLDLSEPYFVCLGTIEPRKNHALLLDIWETLAARPGPTPRLFILGNRGWADPQLFARLDRAPAAVSVMSNLGDSAVAALVASSRALLFPTLAEGFGLPALEAAALGVPVIASDLPVLHELLGDYPVYLRPGDRYSWQRTILDRILQDPSQARGRLEKGTPTWSDHLEIVLTSL